MWSDECEIIFKKFNELLTNALIFTLPFEGDGFTVYCDTLSVGLGCVLLKKDRVNA